MSAYVKVLFHLMWWQLLWIESEVSAGTCREAQLCCNGRDSSCVVQKTPINAIIEDLNDKPCYCDHACLKLGDCCVDFKSHCGVVDCDVSEWGSWSECDASCGSGIMLRSRTIIQATENGGKHCPSLIQKRGCQGYRCHEHKNRKVLKEMALLLPAVLSKNRHLNDSSDIRKNLRQRYHDSYKHNRDHEYCVEFEVIKASKKCHKLPPYNEMTEGDRISVHCELEAFIQEPINSNRTNNLHQINEISDNSAVQDVDENNNNNNDGDYYDDQPSSTSVHHRQTAQTKKPTLKYRCRGEGLTGHTTRWSALAAPACRGKWLRLTLDEPKNCSNSQFIFV